MRKEVHQCQEVDNENMKGLKVVIVDSEDGYGGGSVYLKRYKRWLEKKKVYCSYRQISRDLSGLWEAICLVMRSWIRDDIEVKGTVPIDIILLMAAKRSVGYVQSPPEYWSDKSRLALRLACMAEMIEIRCVSETTAASVDKICKSRGRRIEYAKIDKSTCRHVLLRGQDKHIVFIVLDQGNPKKGYHRHLEIVREAAKVSSTRVELYGRRYGEGFREITCTTFNGYVEDPFCHAKERYKDCRIVYLGCSEFEGLHMAVVDGARVGIPSILSDIPAHRELERICGSPLLISGGGEKDMCLVKEMTENEKMYIEEVERHRELADKFHALTKDVIVFR